jgi:hypothetical protein
MALFRSLSENIQMEDSNVVQYKSHHSTSSGRPVQIVSLFDPNLYHNNGTTSDEWRDCQYPKTDVLRNLYWWTKADSARINIYPHEPEDMTVAPRRHLAKKILCQCRTKREFPEQAADEGPTRARGNLWELLQKMTQVVAMLAQLFVAVRNHQRLIL